MMRSSRYSIYLFLMVIYLLINLSPLAPLAMWSPRVAHAVTGECVGDCNICRCSAEQRANHTCCCWQKKQMKEKENAAAAADCCNAGKKKAEHHHQQEGDCCKKKASPAKVVLKCSCPCENGKQVGITGMDKTEQIPYQFTAGIPFSYRDPFAGVYEMRLTARFGDSPDQPPKITRLS